MSKIIDGGIVSAYGAAVRGGYQGTYSEFCTALGQLAEVLEEFKGFSVEVTTLSAGSSATASYEDGVLTLGIPKGDTGNGIESVTLTEDYKLTLIWTNGDSVTVGPIRGATGATPNIQIGTVTTGEAGSSAAATITGTDEEPVLNLTIPQGLKGDAGNGDMIADDFSTSASYAAGDYVIYNGSLYRFTAAHAAGAWTGTDATAVQLAEDVSALKSQLTSITGNSIIDMVYGKYISLSGSSISMTDGYPSYTPGSTTYSCGITPCVPGDVFTISGTGGSSTRLWGFVDSAGNILSVAPASTTLTNYYLVAPTDSAFLINHDNSGKTSFIGKHISYEVSELNTRFNDLVVKGNQKNLFANPSWGYLAADGSFTSDQASTNRCSDYIPLNNETKITLQVWWSAVPTGITQWYGICFYDSSKNLIGSRSTGTANSTYMTVTKTAPSGAAYVRVSCRVYNDWKVMVQYGDILSVWTLPEAEVETQINNSNYLYNKSDDLYIKSVNHRGWFECPENTEIAFIESKKHGYNYVESDVNFTSDGVPVMLHDRSINRTARNQDGTTISGTVNIDSITYAQAETYDYGIYKGDQFAGEKLLTFDEFLEICKRLALKPYIELKADVAYPQSYYTNLVSSVKAAGMEKSVTWISFSLGYLDYIKQADNSARLGYLVTSIDDSLFVSGSSFMNLKTLTNEIFLDSSSYDTTAVTKCSTNEIPLEIWTIDSTNIVKNMNIYISGITTNALKASEILREELYS